MAQANAIPTTVSSDLVGRRSMFRTIIRVGSAIHLFSPNLSITLTRYFAGPAGLVGFAPSLVVHSRYVKEDIWLVFFVILLIIGIPLTSLY